MTDCNEVLPGEQLGLGKGEIREAQAQTKETLSTGILAS
jgi:hypothetical protein